MSRCGVEDLGGWRLGAKASKEGSPVAKLIVKLGNGGGEGGRIGSAFREGLRLVVGKGDKVAFWYDNWLGERPLREAFSRLFRAAINEDTPMEEYYGVMNGQPQWKRLFRRNLRERSNIRLQNDCWGKLKCA